MTGRKRRPVADAARAARMFDAVNAYERQAKRKVPLDELGRLVAAEEGRPDEPYAASVVSRWIRGISEPRSTAGWQALARVLGVDPGWLAFGSETPLAVRGAVFEREMEAAVPARRAAEREAEQAAAASRPAATKAAGGARRGKR